jgi:hypothetical protein
MTTPNPNRSMGAQAAYEPLSRPDKLEENASLAAAAAAGALRTVEVVAVVLIGLLVCPPLAVLAFTIVAPLLVVALVLGLLVAIVSTPYLLVHHFRGQHVGHLSLLARRLRLAARAVIDLAPHRIVADARKLESRPSARSATGATDRGID